MTGSEFLYLCIAKIETCLHITQNSLNWHWKKCIVITKQKYCNTEVSLQGKTHWDSLAFSRINRCVRNLTFV